jgi:hypothetical protein
MPLRSPLVISGGEPVTAGLKLLMGRQRGISRWRMAPPATIQTPAVGAVENDLQLLCFSVPFRKTATESSVCGLVKGGFSWSCQADSHREDNRYRWVL